MRIYDNTPKDKAVTVDRRSFLATSGAAALVVTSGAVICPSESWGLEAKNLSPEVVRTLIKMARDIYPHDRLSDKYYAAAIKGYDDKSGSDGDLKKTLTEGVAKLDAAAKTAHGVGYADVGWEDERVAILRGMQSDGFFQKIRGDLVVSLYNQKEVWEKFGYEGESASKGGYIKRGFDDIDWL
jgi:hypothetical protein